MKALIAAIALALLAGCQPTQYVQASDKSVIPLEEAGWATERCYKGVVYVNFGPGNNSSWGGARFGADGKIVTCGA